MNTLYPEALAPRILRPQRPSASECRIKAHQILLDVFDHYIDVITPGDRADTWIVDDPQVERSLAQELWEALPSQAFTDDPLRGFINAEIAAEITAACPLGDTSPWPLSTSASHESLASPHTLREAITLAADPQGMLTVEQLAREFVARLRVFNERTPERVLWRVADGWGTHRGDARSRFRPPFSRLLSVAGVREYARFEVRAKARYATISNPVAALDARGATEWQRLCQDGATVWDDLREGNAIPAVCTFAELPDPFEPLLGVWAAGYAVEAVTDRAILLVAPPL